MKMNVTKTKAPEEFLLRRRFLTKAGGAGLAAAAALLLPGKAALAESNPEDAELDNTSGDTANEILTAALIAEDLATTFYYNGLIGPVIHDPALAGTGSAKNPSPNANPGNVDYLTAAFVEEAQHASLLRSVLNLGTYYNVDPVQTFYLPTGTFEDVTMFTGVLDALEKAFIGAYMSAIIEFAQMATDSRANGVRQYKDAAKKYPYGARELQWLSQVAASILGVECEHRALGRVISNTNPANQYYYEQTDGVATVYNGADSAVAALTPFLGPGSGMTAYSLRSAVAGLQGYAPGVSGTIPPAPAPRSDGQ